MKQRLLSLIAGLLFATGVIADVATPSAPATDAEARQLWQLLDYIAVDYPGAVTNGVVLSAGEYQEMLEFAMRARQQAERLPQGQGKPAVLAAIAQLESSVQEKQAPAEVARLAQQASRKLLDGYPIPLAPNTPPDLKKGATLYAAHCAGCHGMSGHADGPLAAQLDPKPVAFSEPERARSRSLLALYLVVSQGLSGTAMVSYAGLPDADRWALAFYVGTLSHDDGMRERGAELWRQNTSLQTQLGDLAALTTATEASLVPAMPGDSARDVMAFLRTHPEALAKSADNGLALARQCIRESLSAAQAGDAVAATRLALSAYLDGFEPTEPLLSARNPALLQQVESAMLQYRHTIADDDREQAAAIAQQLSKLFDQVEAELVAGTADPMTTFIGALTILLREGLEALLIVIGILAFLKKAERNTAIRQVHFGWVSALLAGGLTWFAATYLVDISGASREVTEGLSSLLAAVVLLGVGIWMHQKSAAGHWQAYLKEKLSTAVSHRSAWALFALAFIAVYREVFETILFYSALAVDGNGSALLAGLLAGIALLAIVAWLLLRTSARMPIGKFFSLSSVLVAILAVVLAGKGVAGLQEAGWLSANPLPGPRLEVLGMYPSVETVSAQVIVLLIAALGFGLNLLSVQRLSNKSH
ncbi:c-type cytochrome [Permianibacter sp. IMCC34836]|uniref:cytochrome c/FTR1 family iron permease n=1 Tax=Permianibacter fluminis TaxID=2738515 RepID=UPI0015529A04|nr:cytochrome c/FTR1 family iron permease [Permianibacter fluminis]NQD37640.1 c-type cytochrome [Permianibacter fluminis]